MLTVTAWIGQTNPGFASLNAGLPVAVMSVPPVAPTVLWAQASGVNPWRRFRARDHALGFRRDFTSAADRVIPWSVKAPAAAAATRTLSIDAAIAAAHLLQAGLGAAVARQLTRAATLDSVAQRSPSVIGSLDAVLQGAAAGPRRVGARVPARGARATPGGSSRSRKFVVPRADGSE